jgi:hypothetical protein
VPQLSGDAAVVVAAAAAVALVVVIVHERGEQPFGFDGPALRALRIVVVLVRGGRPEALLRHLVRLRHFLGRPTSFDGPREAVRLRQLLVLLAALVVIVVVTATAAAVTVLRRRRALIAVRASRPTTALPGPGHWTSPRR